MIKKIKYFYWDLIPYEYRLLNLWYKLKCLLFYRYSTVKPRHLGHTWVDKPELMVHTLFEILSRFWEDEIPNSWVEWREGDWAPRYNGELVIDIIERLYNWYHLDYVPYSKYETQMILHNIRPDAITHFPPVFHSEDDEMLYCAVYEAINEYEDDIEQELEESLKLLMGIRRYLWT